MHKLDALTRILEAEDIDGMIVFVRTKTATVDLAEKLEARGFSSSTLNGDMNQALREKTVDRLKKGQLDIVVATDVAARGLDVKRISHVVNYDIPYDTEAYVHRIGRTGRAGREGHAILFVAPREMRMLATIERATRQPIKPMSLPSRQAIVDKRICMFTEQITQVMESEDLEFFEELVDSYQHEHDNGHRRIAAALAFLAQKGRPLQPDETQIRDIPDTPPARRSENRGSRGSRGSRGESGSEAGFERYRIEVGAEQGVQPKHIVGAIANEANIDSQSIGQIKINADHCMVDLPENLPPAVVKHLNTVWICGQRMRISSAGPSTGGDERSSAPAKRRTFKKNLGGSRYKPSPGKNRRGPK
jgi:ATP-dependent RNA helicase DeaD